MERSASIRTGRWPRWIRWGEGFALGFVLWAALERPARAVSSLPSPRAQDTPTAPDVHADQTSLGEAEVRGLCSCYRRTDRWALQALVLSSLGGGWHPEARSILLEALRDRRKLLHAFAIEALRRTRTDQLRGIADVELLDLLVRKECRARPALRAERAMDLLQRIAPDSGARSAVEWHHWWSRVRGRWTPPPWSFVEPPPAEGPNTEAFMARVFDLHEHGLDLAFCLDATGSMQPTIDAVRDALGAMVTVLASVAPRFRVGVVQYRDFQDLRHGAEVLQPLTARVERVQGQLQRLLAQGGGDVPERVECGLATVLDRRKMGWSLGAEKLVVLIGDAPPHPEDLDECVERVRAAHLHPFVRRPGTTVLRHVRPFVVSAVGVGEVEVLASTGSSFEAIARAGAGAYVPLLSEGNDAALDPGRRVLRHVLEMSFGVRWSGSIELFLRTFLEYHEAGVR